MAKKIQDLTSKSPIIATDQFIINDVVGGNLSKKVDASTIKIYVKDGMVKGDVGLGNIDNTSDTSKPISDLTQTALDNKSAVGHTHTRSEITDFTHTHTPSDITGTAVVTTDSRLSDSRTPLAHTHIKSEITDFSHTHPQSEITNLVTDLSNKSAVGHTHTIADVTSLQTTLDAKYSASNRQNTIVNSEISTVDASKITTGQLAMARIASGTPDGTKFVRDDGTLQSPGASSTNIKQTEVDFGTTPVYETIFTITDADVSVGSQLISNLAYEAPTGKDLDELEFDDSLSIICTPLSGSFDMKIHSIDGTYLADKFKVNYLIG